VFLNISSRTNDQCIRQLVGIYVKFIACILHLIRRCIQKFPDWPPGARSANGTALFHQVQLYRPFVSQSNEFCCYNPLCCFSTRLLLLFISLSTQSGNFWIHPLIDRVIKTRRMKWAGHMACMEDSCLQGTGSEVRRKETTGKT
jgi:hypothetical protein